MGKYLDRQHYDTVVSGESVDVFKPDGSPLLLFRHRAIAIDVCERARPALRKASKARSEHRGYSSAIIGYFDKPTCRKTNFTGSRLDDWGHCLPFIRACNSVFRRENRLLQSRYATQRTMAYSTAAAYRIEGTAFTTATINVWNASQDARTPVHKDAGDLPEGFGVISAISHGNYVGGYLIFPAYRVAVDIRTTDVLLCDVHEYHGNAPIVGESGWERISCILYFRTAMQHCPEGTGNSG